MVKNLPAMQKTWVQSLDQEDTVDKEMATPSTILAWRILWTEETGGLPSMCKELDMTEQLTHTCTQLLFYFLFCFLPFFFQHVVFVLFFALFPSWHCVSVLFSSLCLS